MLDYLFKVDMRIPNGGNSAFFSLSETGKVMDRSADSGTKEDDVMSVAHLKKVRLGHRDNRLSLCCETGFPHCQDHADFSFPCLLLSIFHNSDRRPKKKACHEKGRDTERKEARAEVKVDLVATQSPKRH